MKNTTDNIIHFDENKVTRRESGLLLYVSNEIETEGILLPNEHTNDNTSLILLS